MFNLIVKELVPHSEIAVQLEKQRRLSCSSAMIV